MYAINRRTLALCFASAVVAIAIALAGCSSSDAPPESSGPSPSSTPGETRSPHDHGEDDDHPSVPVPEAGESSQKDAVTAAAAAITAFARPTLPEQQWWTELLPLLSQKGAVAYEGTLPSNIPVTAVTGPGIVLPASTEVATLVEVPTDAGAYIVSLVRSSSDQPWLAERIRPAGQ